MLWTVGIIALLQVCVLPGAVLLRFIRPKGLNAIEQGVGVFASSLMLNHLLVAVFTLLHVGRPETWWVVMAAEVIYLAVGWRSWFKFWSVDLRWMGKARLPSIETAIAGIFLLASLVVLMGLLGVNWGSVYVGNDDVANWDHWATEWAGGNLSSRTGLYPQLLPTNGSISYLLIGNVDVKMFAKATTPLYAIGTVLLFLSLAIRRRDPSYLIGGTIFTAMLLQYMGTVFMTYGYADIPLAFFGFLTFYCVVATAGPPERDSVIAMLFFSCGALLTKQGGIYAVVAAVAYASFWKFAKPLKEEASRRLFRMDAATWILAIFAVFSAAWYGVKFVQIRLGTDYSNMVLLTQVLHHGRNYAQRMVAIYAKFLHEPPPNIYLTIPLSLLLVASLLFRRTRSITILVVFPFLLAYAFWFSYEIRNSLMAFPLIAVVCGGAVHELLVRFVPCVSRSSKVNYTRFAVTATGLLCLLIRYQGWLITFWIPLLSFSVMLLAMTYLNLSSRIIVPLGSLFLAGLLGFTCWGAITHPPGVILTQQKDAARKTVGDPAIADHLYAVVHEKNIKSGIITYYWFLRGLPEIRQLFRQTGACHPCTVAALETALAEHPGANFIMMPDQVLAPETLKSLPTSNEFTTVFDVDGWRLLEFHPTLSRSIP